MAIKIQLRRDTAANWVLANPILASGEEGLEMDTGKRKIGNGVDAWATLGYMVGGATDAADLAFTPYGNITATNTQVAIQELDDEKVSAAEVGTLLKPTGIISGGVVTLNVDTSKIDISACEYFIQGIKYSYVGVTGYTPPLGVGESSCRIGLNAGGLISQQGNFSDAQKQTILPIARIQAVQGSTGLGSLLITPIDQRYIISETGYRDRIWQENVFGALYPETGGEYSEHSTPLRITQASGSFFDAQGKQQTIAATPQISAKYVYHIAGVWSVQPESVLVVNTSQYDNGTNLTTLSDSYWVCHTLLKSPKSADEFFLIVGNAQHTTQTEAEASDVNYGPFASEANSSLIAVAKFVVRKGTTSVNRIVNISPRIKGSNIEGSGISALLPTVSNPAELKNYEDAWTHYNSATVAHGCNITDNGNGTVTIGAGEVAIRSAAVDYAPLSVYAIGSSGVLTPTDNDVTYYYINYNNGAPVWASGTSITDYNGLDKVQGYTIGRRGTSLWIVDSRGQAVDGNRKIRRRDLEWSGSVQNGFWHTSGGSVIGASGLNPTLTSGKFYYGAAPVTHIGFDTTIAGTANANVFDYYYNRGTYTLITNQKTINNTQYDNAGTLTAFSPNNYRTDWAYIVLDGGSPRFVVVMGNAQYSTLTAAQAAPVPATVPAFMDGISVLVGQIVAQQGVASLTVRTALGSTFTSASVNTHNSLSGLQGGTTNEYYHLTSAEYTAVLNSQFPVVDSTAIVKGSGDATKLVRMEVDGLTTGTTRVISVQDKDYILAGTNVPQAFTAIQTSTPVVITDQVSPSWNVATIQSATLAPADNRTVTSTGTPPDGTVYMLTVTPTGAFTTSFDAAKFSGLAGITPSATAGKTDCWIFRSDGTKLNCVGFRTDIGS